MKHLGTEILSTDRLILRRFLIEDAEVLCLGYINQDEFLYYANKERISVTEEKLRLERLKEKYKSLDYYNWVIILKEKNIIIGSINLKANLGNDSVEFNYAIDNRYCNNGYMTEALKEIKEFCFERMKVKRFQGGCCIENIASKRVMEKCGMQCEGILRGYIKLRDGYHDMYMYSIINEV